MKENTAKDKQPPRDIVFNKTVKAGRRIYYFDVKQSRNKEMYVSITESKKILSGDLLSPNIRFEKHKLFLYQEDMSNFSEALQEVVQFVTERQACSAKGES